MTMRGVSQCSFADLAFVQTLSPLPVSVGPWSAERTPPKPSAAGAYGMQEMGRRQDRQDRQDHQDRRVAQPKGVPQARHRNQSNAAPFSAGETLMKQLQRRGSGSRADQ